MYVQLSFVQYTQKNKLPHSERTMMPDSSLSERATIFHGAKHHHKLGDVLDALAILHESKQHNKKNYEMFGVIGAKQHHKLN